MFNNKGLTLAELIVSTVVVGIVMVGVASFTTSMKNIQDTTTTSARLQLQLAGVLKMIEIDASRATGHINNLGVRKDNNPAGGGTALCFYQDLPTNPNDFDQDRWVCWFRPNGATLPLSRCFFVPDNRIDDADPIAFNNGDCQQAVSRVDYIPVDIGFFSADNFLIDGKVSITLTTRDNIAVANNPMTNPQFTMQTTLSFPLHSMN